MNSFTKVLHAFQHLWLYAMLWILLRYFQAVSLSFQAVFLLQAIGHLKQQSRKSGVKRVLCYFATTCSIFTGILQLHGYNNLSKLLLLELPSLLNEANKIEWMMSLRRNEFCFFFNWQHLNISVVWSRPSFIVQLRNSRTVWNLLIYHRIIICQSKNHTSPIWK